MKRVSAVVIETHTHYVCGNVKQNYFLQNTLSALQVGSCLWQSDEPVVLV